MGRKKERERSGQEYLPNNESFVWHYVLSGLKKMTFIHLVQLLHVFPRRLLYVFTSYQLLCFQHTFRIHILRTNNQITSTMTSEFNKKLPLLQPKEVIGTKRRPTRRDLTQRDLPPNLPDLEPHIDLQRAALKLQTATLMSQQQILNSMQPESAMRESLTVLADAYNDPSSDSDWETLTPSSPEMEEQVERYVEDNFLAKVKGVELKKVMDARVVKRRLGMQAFAKKVRTVRGRATQRTAAKRAVSPPLASPSRAAAEADAADAARAAARAADAADAADAARAAARAAEAASSPTPTLSPMEPAITRELTVAQAVLALTNSQTGTNVTMEDLKTVMDIEDDEETYTWVVSGTETRELTVAEAALVLTNMQAGTDVTMQDLTTARLMVDLWDNEDVYQWTVGNFE